ncbi:hypothetical protein KRR38_06755 [Novosphingobium sp. G106]|uniref:hypothetical protein n=1 Tax=Novosphingobium sp. G106 TaxID=2849500 RepID=UPI001C2D0C8D|nr:hypothetical protein [Novosphingobium sp. G106]MBV1687382.1 hypothetical protein [Novosphingobium sp. G106]
MGEALERAKATRNAAHDALQLQLAQVREDLAARGIGGRIADRAGEVVADAAEIANENKGIIAGTLTAIALWFLRGPIVGLATRLWERGDDDDEEDDDERNDDD